MNMESTHIQKARLYITSLGLYEAEINGKRVGDHVLAPGFQPFKHRHVYDTYDVTEAVLRGRNAIDPLIADGWYASGLFGHTEKGEFGNLYGDRIGAMEIYDSRKESVIKGWSTASFDNGDWLSVEELPPLTAALVPSDGPPVRKLTELQPKEILQTVSGKVIVDFGQNFAGCARITVSGPSDTSIILRHAEVLENGEIGTKSPRTADPTDRFILNGTCPQVWEPRFTFHGFRYVKTSNWPVNHTPLEPEAITDIAVWSDMNEQGGLNSLTNSWTNFTATSCGLYKTILFIFPLTARSVMDAWVGLTMPTFS
ncbi:hypothetical protein Forpe1208_v015067 [Fusarium oxysporum f. sp. rapae]|uniref:Alpha-L-rhamnosidase n=1 Tax=Fusarium oxysporum f. sp. rapae TaxID=485398 RepID=A0A8J5NJC3_FUSOX|nr:hypothetical protein Forpe1208_v015067 [Fusarium oxysporum f. sp. rapae]